MRKAADFLKALLFLGSVAVLSAWLAAQSTEELVAAPRILDGDSLSLAGEEVRLLGIDAPEHDQTCKRLSDQSSFRCGRAARNHLRKLIAGQEVRCEGWERDKFDRLLATCHAGSVNLNREMVLDGWALSFGDYESEEANASDKGAGLWSSEFQSPAAWRQAKRAEHTAGWMARFRFW